eukprot:scaffold14537_cov45-Cyclotella_meneghiniana.AAC.7
MRRLRVVRVALRRLGMKRDDYRMTCVAIVGLTCIDDEDASAPAMDTRREFFGGGAPKQISHHKWTRTKKAKFSARMYVFFFGHHSHLMSAVVIASGVSSEQCQFVLISCLPLE